MAQQQEQKDTWPADLYGEKIDEIIDIGSGEGPLTTRIALHVKRIVGIDGSANMIEHFKKAYPYIESRVVDCRLLDQETDLATGNFDKVFSNASLHWILKDPEPRSNTIKGCFEALKPGGLLVSGSGALGNMAKLFPSQQAMKELIEGAGFNWIKGEVRLRQTTLTENEKCGVEGWIHLFGGPFLELLPTIEARDAAVKHAVDVLETVGRQQHDGSFAVNYIRLRFVARKPQWHHLSCKEFQSSDTTYDISCFEIVALIHSISRKPADIASL
ncbi:unnamed protein product [Penicillium discolor]